MEVVVTGSTPDLSQAVRTAIAGRATLVETDGLDQLKGSPLVVVVGPGSDAPIALAQATGSRFPHAAIVLAADADRVDAWRRAVVLAPFLGSPVEVTDVSRPHDVVKAVQVALHRASVRQRNEAMIAFAQASLGSTAARPPETARVVLDHLLRTAPLGVAIVDDDDRIRAWNESAHRMTGRRERDVLGSPLRSVLGVGSDGLGPDGTVVPLIDPDDTWVKVLAAPLDGAASGHIVMWNDVTAQQKAEAALRAANAELERRVAARTTQLKRSVAELREHAKVASHDLQEPLRELTWRAQFLRDRLGDDQPADVQENVEHLVAAAGRMRALVHALHQVSTLSEAVPTVEPVRLTHALRRAVQELDGARRVVVREDLTLDADARLFGLVLRELTTNALVFSGADGRVEVSGSVSDDGWTVRVDDSGPGIPEPYRERVFGLFERLSASGPPTGVGAGLALCSKAVAAWGGRIWVEPSPLGGAGLVFTVPRSAVHLSD